MCGKCPGCKAILRVALAARDVAQSLPGDVSLFVVGHDTIISPTRPRDEPGKHGCFVMLSPTMSDDVVTAHVNEAFARADKSFDRVFETLTKLAKALGATGPSN